MPNGVIVRFDYHPHRRIGVVAVKCDLTNLVWLRGQDLPTTIIGRLATRSLKGTPLNDFRIAEIGGLLCAVDIVADVPEPRVGNPISPDRNGAAAMVATLFLRRQPRPAFCHSTSGQTAFAFVPRLPRFGKAKLQTLRKAAERAGVKWIEVIVCRTVTLYATAVVNRELVLVKSQALVCPWNVVRSQTTWAKVDYFKEVPTAAMPKPVQGLLTHINTLRPATQPRSSAQARAQFLLALARLDLVGRVAYTSEEMIRNVAFPPGPSSEDLAGALAQANKSATASA